MDKCSEESHGHRARTFEPPIVQSLTQSLDHSLKIQCGIPSIDYCRWGQVVGLGAAIVADELASFRAPLDVLDLAATADGFASFIEKCRKDARQAQDHPDSDSDATEPEAATSPAR